VLEIIIVLKIVDIRDRLLDQKDFGGWPGLINRYHSSGPAFI
jgi:hypothetical protein